MVPVWKHGLRVEMEPHTATAAFASAFSRCGCPVRLGRTAHVGRRLCKWATSLDVVTDGTCRPVR